MIEEAFDIEIEYPTTYIERNCIYYQVPVCVAKDLEVLEILKKIVSIKDYNPTEYPPFIILSGGEVKNIEDAKKIKEWLENE